MIDAHRIAPKLWMGSYPRDRTVCDGRFGLVVLAAIEHPELPYACRKQRVLHVPLFDAEPMNDEIALAILAARRVNEMRARGRRVLVTCHQGVNRSGLVVALALVLDGHSAAEAIEIIRERRYRAPWKALSNKHFVRTIEAFAEKVREHRGSARP